MKNIADTSQLLLEGRIYLDFFGKMVTAKLENGQIIRFKVENLTIKIRADPKQEGNFFGISPESEEFMLRRSTISGNEDWVYIHKYRKVSVPCLTVTIS